MRAVAEREELATKPGRLGIEGVGDRRCQAILA
jgi:hypothetical protein